MAAIPNWQDAFQRTGQTKPARVETVVLAIENGSGAKTALGVARKLSRVYDATLHVLCFERTSGGACEQLARFGIPQANVQDAVLDTVPPDAESVVAAVQELPSPLLVMPGAKPGKRADAELTAVAAEILQKRLRRVVLVGPNAKSSGWKLDRVLLAHDGKPSTDVATAEAAEVAHRAGAEVVAIHVASRRSEPQEPGSIPAPRYIDQPQHEWPSWASEFLDRMIALGSPPAKLKFKLMVTGGQPGSEIAHFARENKADMVVAAWHGGWDDEHGRLLQVVVRRAPCPVLLVYAPEPGEAR